MPELGPYGSVRVALSNERPYRDRLSQAAFFITEDALKRVQPDMRPVEAGLLRVFDANWDVICATAAKVYARGHKGSYDLVKADF